jgi:small subunit ribosomal protein S15
MITKEAKANLVKEFGAAFGAGEKDAGCAPVQVAILTTRINNLMGHFKKHIHDNHSNTGLMKMIGRRRRLLKYIQTNDDAKYKAVIAKLGLRK